MDYETLKAAQRAARRRAEDDALARELAAIDARFAKARANTLKALRAHMTAEPSPSRQERLDSLQASVDQLDTLRAQHHAHAQQVAEIKRRIREAAEDDDHAAQDAARSELRALVAPPQPPEEPGRAPYGLRPRFV